MNNLIHVENKEGMPVVSSTEVAKHFEKQHKHVLDAIREIECETSAEKTANLFIESNYKDSYGRNQIEYLLSKNGFVLLAMGFTGKKALEWKLKYIEAFDKMEMALRDVYHISETAIVNNMMGSLESKLFNQIDKRFSMYEENYRPTHANKIDINRYIKNLLGEDREEGEVEKVKERMLLLLDGESWQDIPYKKIIDNLHLVDESVRSIMSFRVKKQLSIFEEN